MLRRLAGLCLCLLALGAAAVELPLLLAERYEGDVDVTRYWVSEKLDGVRAHWDGRRLRFRSGHPVPAPRWFTDALPAQSLDGELWLGRGRFDRLSGIVRRSVPVDAEWREVRYMIFELPDAAGDFTERIRRIEALTAAAGVSWLQPVAQFRLSDAAALQVRLDAVVRGGGEGLMLHRAGAPYTTGRSADLLKLTPWRDAEARVVAHLPGKGRHAGRLGALRVAMPDGKTFSLGSGFSTVQRRDPPPVGSLVTYRYRELTHNGIPRFPRFLRVRESF